MKANWTKTDFRLAKNYPNLAKRAKLNNQTPSDQSLIDQKNAISDYEDTYIVNGKDILTGVNI